MEVIKRQSKVVKARPRKTKKIFSSPEDSEEKKLLYNFLSQLLPTNNLVCLLKP